VNRQALTDAHRRTVQASFMTLAEFAAMHEVALERNAARHIMMLGLLASAQDGHVQDVKAWSLGQPGQCAMMGPRRTILLGDLDEGQCRAFAEAMAEIPYDGVIGPGHTAHCFSHRATDLGARFMAPMPQRMHSLTERPRYPGVAGHAQQAAIDDTDVLTNWIEEFNREATPHEAPPSREYVASGIANGRYFVWIVDGQPVSTAAIVRRTRTAGGIASVFTPARLRAKGYAGSVTAAVVDHLFGEGRTLACINTDLRNPSSNRCYEKIGFKPVCDLAFYGRSTYPPRTA
jgi:RimJ/RimL family protein N-acetyltransferase